MNSYKPLRMYRDGETLPPGAPPRPEGASSVYLYDEAKGTGVWVGGYVSDGDEGLTDADFDFEAGKRWAAEQSDTD